MAARAFSKNEGAWRRWIDTARAAPDDIVAWDEAPAVADESYLGEPRSLVVPGCTARGGRRVEMAPSTTQRNEVFLVRHGETEWSLSGQHTGVTDIPLTEHGRCDARRLEPLLSRAEFTLVLSSPLQRARHTCELAGLGRAMQIDPDLMEWNYGQYEGLTPAQIKRTAPAWVLFTDGCPGGESPDQVGARVDRLIARVRAVAGRVALFAHGHVFRVFAARWLGLPPTHGRHFLLHTSTLSILGYYRGIPAVSCWNAPLEGERLLQ